MTEHDDHPDTAQPRRPSERQGFNSRAVASSATAPARALPSGRRADRVAISCRRLFGVPQYIIPTPLRSDLRGRPDVVPRRIC